MEYKGVIHIEKTTGEEPPLSPGVYDKNKENKKLRNYIDKGDIKEALEQVDFMQENNVDIERKCFYCNVNMEKNYNVKGKLHGSNTTLEGLINYVCPKCGELVYPFESVDKLLEWMEAGFELIKE